MLNCLVPGANTEDRNQINEVACERLGNTVINRIKKGLRYLLLISLGVSTASCGGSDGSESERAVKSGGSTITDTTSVAYSQIVSLIDIGSVRSGGEYELIDLDYSGGKVLLTIKDLDDGKSDGVIQVDLSNPDLEGLNGVLIRQSKKATNETTGVLSEISRSYYIDLNEEFDNQNEEGESLFVMNGATTLVAQLIETNSLSKQDASAIVANALGIQVEDIELSDPSPYVKTQIFKVDVLLKILSANLDESKDVNKLISSIIYNNTIISGNLVSGINIFSQNGLQSVFIEGDVNDDKKDAISDMYEYLDSNNVTSSNATELEEMLEDYNIAVDSDGDDQDVIIEPDPVVVLPSYPDPDLTLPPDPDIADEPEIIENIVNKSTQVFTIAEDSSLRLGYESLDLGGNIVSKSLLVGPEKGKFEFGKNMFRYRPYKNENGNDTFTLSFENIKGEVFEIEYIILIDAFNDYPYIKGISAKKLDDGRIEVEFDNFDADGNEITIEMNHEKLNPNIDMQIVGNKVYYEALAEDSEFINDNLYLLFKEGSGGNDYHVWFSADITKNNGVPDIGGSIITRAFSENRTMSGYCHFPFDTIDININDTNGINLITPPVNGKVAIQGYHCNSFGNENIIYNYDIDNIHGTFFGIYSALSSVNSYCHNVLKPKEGNYLQEDLEADFNRAKLYYNDSYSLDKEYSRKSHVVYNSTSQWNVGDFFSLDYDDGTGEIRQMNYPIAPYLKAKQVSVNVNSQLDFDILKLFPFHRDLDKSQEFISENVQILGVDFSTEHGVVSEEVSDLGDVFYRYIPNIDYYGNDNVTFRYSVKGIDGEYYGKIPLRINAIPQVSGEFSAQIDENQDVSFDLSVSDADGDQVSIAIENPANIGIVTFGTGGNIIYTANPDEYGDDSFTIKIDDGNSGVVYKDFEVKINPNYVRLLKEAKIAKDGLTIRIKELEELLLEQVELFEPHANTGISLDMTEQELSDIINNYDFNGGAKPEYEAGSKKHNVYDKNSPDWDHYDVDKNNLPFKFWHRQEYFSSGNYKGPVGAFYGQSYYSEYRKTSVIKEKIRKHDTILKYIKEKEAYDIAMQNIEYKEELSEAKLRLNQLLVDIIDYEAEVFGLENDPQLTQIKIDKYQESLEVLRIQGFDYYLDYIPLTVVLDDQGDDLDSPKLKVQCARGVQTVSFEYKEEYLEFIQMLKEVFGVDIQGGLIDRISLLDTQKWYGFTHKYESKSSALLNEKIHEYKMNSDFIFVRKLLHKLPKNITLGYPRFGMHAPVIKIVFHEDDDGDLDSVEYMPKTAEQYRDFIETFKDRGYISSVYADDIIGALEGNLSHDWSFFNGRLKTLGEGKTDEDLKALWEQSSQKASNNKVLPDLIIAKDPFTLGIRPISSYVYAPEVSILYSSSLNEEERITFSSPADLASFINGIKGNVKQIALPGGDIKVGEDSYDLFNDYMSELSLLTEMGIVWSGFNSSLGSWDDPEYCDPVGTDAEISCSPEVILYPGVGNDQPGVAIPVIEILEPEEDNSIILAPPDESIEFVSIASLSDCDCFLYKYKDINGQNYLKIRYSVEGVNYFTGLAGYGGELSEDYVTSELTNIAQKLEAIKSGNSIPSLLDLELNYKSKLEEYTYVEGDIHTFIRPGNEGLYFAYRELYQVAFLQYALSNDEDVISAYHQAATKITESEIAKEEFNLGRPLTNNEKENINIKILQNLKNGAIDGAVDFAKGYYEDAKFLLSLEFETVKKGFLSAFNAALNPVETASKLADIAIEQKDMIVKFVSKVDIVVGFLGSEKISYGGSYLGVVLLGEGLDPFGKITSLLKIGERLHGISNTFNTRISDVMVRASAILEFKKKRLVDFIELNQGKLDNLILRHVDVLDLHKKNVGELNDVLSEVSDFGLKLSDVSIKGLDRIAEKSLLDYKGEVKLSDFKDVVRSKIIIESKRDVDKIVARLEQWKIDFKSSGKGGVTVSNNMSDGGIADSGFRNVSIRMTVKNQYGDDIVTELQLIPRSLENVEELTHGIYEEIRVLDKIQDVIPNSEAILGELKKRLKIINDDAWLLFK